MSEIEFMVRSGNVIDGVAKYIDAEGSFDFDYRPPSPDAESAGSEGVTSILVDTLQIEIDVEHRSALHVWGYHPREAWNEGEVVPPSFHEGAVFISSRNELIPGVSLAIAETGEWLTTYDHHTGWVSVRRQTRQNDDQTVLIATSTLLGLIGSRLNSIWVKPIFL